MVVVTGRDPSPKFHLYVAILPTGEEEPEPSKNTVDPLMDVVKTAVGAWSGVMAGAKGEGRENVWVV